MPKTRVKPFDDPHAAANRAKQARRAARYRAMKAALERIVEAPRVPGDIREMARVALQTTEDAS